MSGRLRVCLIASPRFPVAEPFMGGLEAHTHALARTLTARGHEVSLFAAPGSDPALPLRVLPVSPYAATGAARADVGASPETWMAEHHAYLDLMLGIADGRYGPFDVIHNNSLHHLPVAMSAAVAPPVVTTLHTPPLAWLESAARFAAPTSTFVAVSRATAEAWSGTLHAEVVPNGIDPAFWRAGPGGGGAFWSGRLVPEKAPHDAIDAAVLAGVPIDLAGPAHDPAYFEAEIRPRLGPRVRYLGHVGRSELRVALGTASIAMVTPRWDEPFGLVAVEAMACGTPVAAYDRGALRELVDPVAGVLVPGGDVEGLAAAVRSAARLDRPGVREHAVRHFSHDRMVDGYEAIYRRGAGLRGVA